MAAIACEARSIVLANGVKWRDLDIPSANALVGRGIYYGAARSEAIGCTVTMSSWSAAATRRVRRRCISPTTRDT